MTPKISFHRLSGFLLAFFSLFTPHCRFLPFTSFLYYAPSTCFIASTHSPVCPLRLLLLFVSPFLLYSFASTLMCLRTYCPSCAPQPRYTNPTANHPYQLYTKLSYKSPTTCSCSQVMYWHTLVYTLETFLISPRNIRKIPSGISLAGSIHSSIHSCNREG